MVENQAGGFRTPAEPRTGPEAVMRQAGEVSGHPYLVEVLDALTEFAALLNSDRQMIFANRAMLELLGVDRDRFTPGDLPGEALGCVTCAEGEGRCGFNAPCAQCGGLAAMMGVLERGEPVEGDCRLARQVGGGLTALDLRVRATPFEVNGETYILFVGHDQSDLKRRRALERIFFHDLLNTAGGMRGLALLLKEHEDRETALLAEALYEASESMIQEITSQRDLAKAEASELTLTLRTVDAVGLLRGLAAVQAGRDQDRSVNLEVTADASALEITTDPVILGRVLANMITNAVEAAGPEGTVALGCRPVEGAVEFSVHNGGAMPEEVQLQVFQRSFSTKGAGRGLGTYSMRLLSEQYLGGRVWFTSSQEEGTTFYGRYPLSPPGGNLR